MDHKYRLYIIIALATVRVAGCFEKSAEVMKGMQNLIKVSDISQVMREMSKEMMKVSLILGKYTNNI